MFKRYFLSLNRKRSSKNVQKLKDQVFKFMNIHEYFCSKITEKKSTFYKLSTKEYFLNSTFRRKSGRGFQLEHRLKTTGLTVTHIAFHSK